MGGLVERWTGSCSEAAPTHSKCPWQPSRWQQEGTARTCPTQPQRLVCKWVCTNPAAVEGEWDAVHVSEHLDMLEAPPGCLSGDHHPVQQQVHQEQRKSFDLVSVRAQCLFHSQWDTIFIQTLFYLLLFVNIAEGCLFLPPADRAAHGSLNFTHHSPDICPL